MAGTGYELHTAIFTDGLRIFSFLAAFEEEVATIWFEEGQQADVLLAEAVDLSSGLRRLHQSLQQLGRLAEARQGLLARYTSNELVRAVVSLSPAQPWPLRDRPRRLSSLPRAGCDLRGVEPLRRTAARLWATPSIVHPLRWLGPTVDIPRRLPAKSHRRLSSRSVVQRPREVLVVNVDDVLDPCALVVAVAALGRAPEFAICVSLRPTAVSLSAVHRSYRLRQVIN